MAMVGMFEMFCRVLGELFNQSGDIYIITVFGLREDEGKETSKSEGEPAGR